VRPGDVLQALSDRRAAALVARDTAALGGVHARGSASGASDAALVGRLVDSRVRWVGLRLVVGEATYISGNATGAVLRARVDWTAYAVVMGDGARSGRTADTGRRLDFSLVRAAHGWRLTAVRTAPAT